MIYAVRYNSGPPVSVSRRSSYTFERFDLETSFLDLVDHYKVEVTVTKLARRWSVFHR